MHRVFNTRLFAIAMMACSVIVCQVAQAQVLSLQTFASGFNDPVDIAHANDSRLFIVEQDGIIRILDENGSTLPVPFLNIDPRVGSSGNEQGLLGLAFHPDYANNGYFYVNYTNNSGDTRISRFSVTADPNVADPNSELVIYAFNQDFTNHNGGDLNFGPSDGYLYIGNGDGGSGGDPLNRAQNPLSPLGKMLRIDVDNPSGGNNYGIPPSNPFVGDPNVLDEIWAVGLRNPWRFSFDRLTHDMWIGDVGQNAREEIDFQPASSMGGENYGWRCYEGNNIYNTSGCGPIGNYVFPVVDFTNGGGNCSVTGGMVYRGQKYPNLYGRYLYTDYCSGRFWTLQPDGMGGWTNTQLADLAFGFVAFGENRDGEMFVANIGNGIIYRITDTSLVVEQPESVNVTRGDLSAGDVEELALSDNVDLVLQRAGNDIQSRTEFVVKGVSEIRNPVTLQVTMEGAVFARSTVVQSIELYDYVAGAWVLVDSRNASRFSDSTVTVAATGDLSRFVEETTQCVEARVRFQSTEARQNFSSNTDHFFWTIEQ